MTPSRGAGRATRAVRRQSRAATWPGLLPGYTSGKDHDMTAANWGTLAGLIVTAVAAALAHIRISRHASQPVPPQDEAK
jgi:hypothetical protein